MPDTGWVAPNGADDNDWTNGNNVLASDNQYATSSVRYDQMDVYWDDLGIPWDAVIDGIEVKIEWSSQNAGQAKLGFGLYHSDYDSVDGHYYYEIESEETIFTLTGMTDTVSDAGSSTYLFNPDIREFWKGEDFQNLVMNLWDENGASRVRIDQVLIKVWWHAGRVMGDSIFRGASRQTTVDKIKGAVRSLTANIFYGAQRYPTMGNTNYRTLADNIMRGASRVSDLTRTGGIFVRGMADSIINGVENIIDSCTDSWQTYGMYNGWMTAHSQSFNNSTSKKLKNCKFYLKKTGSPTGNAVAKIYAHSGTFGTSSVPTGSVLATSDNFDVSTLTTSLRWITFNFSGANNIVLSANTKYTVVVSYSGGNASNYISVGLSHSGGSYAAGNWAYYYTSWNPQSYYDVDFYVNSFGRMANVTYSIVYIMAMADYILNGTTASSISFDKANGNAGWYLGDPTVQATGQTYQQPATGILKSCQFALEKILTPTTVLRAKIFRMSGTSGTNGIPTGTALATSDDVNATDVLNINNPDWVTFTFSGANRIKLYKNLFYVVVLFEVGWPNASFPGIIILMDSTSPADQGNTVYSYNSTSFGYQTTTDVCYTVTCDGIPSTVSWIFGHLSLMADNILIGASRAIALTRNAITFTRAISDGIMVGKSRVSNLATGVCSFIRNQVTNIMVAAYGIPTMGLRFTRAMTDSILVGASRVSTLSRNLIIFTRAMADNILVGASRLSTFSKFTHYYRNLSDTVRTYLTSLNWLVAPIKKIQIAIKTIRNSSFVKAVKARVGQTKNITPSMKTSQILADISSPKTKLNIKSKTLNPKVETKSINIKVKTKTVSPDIKNNKPQI